MSGDRPDPWGASAEDAEDPDAPPSGDLIEDGVRPSRLHARWRALPRRVRLIVVALVAVLAVGAGGLQLRSWAVERALAQRVDLAASLDVSGDSRTPPGGQVSFAVVVRNLGPRPVWVTSVEGSAAGLRLRAVDDAERRVAPGDEAAVPLSVRLTCDRFTGGAGLTTAVAVRREDGTSATRRLRPRSADAFTDVATTLCTVRPDLRDQELAGPVLDTPTS